jgi:hypothetical protein
MIKAAGDPKKNSAPSVGSGTVLFCQQYYTHMTISWHQ